MKNEKKEVAEAPQKNEEQQELKESNQPEPVVMEYSQVYKFSDLFLEHLKVCLKDMPHFRAIQYIEFVERNKDGISIVDLNGFIKKLDMIEYGYINGLMKNIKSEEGQAQYFILKEREQK